MYEDGNGPANRRVAFVTLGCRVNQFESDMLLRSGRKAGYRQARSGEKADLVVFNTCSVTGESERQARQAIRRAVRDNPGARVVVTGCYAQRDPETLARIPGVALVLGNGEKKRIFELLEGVDPGQGGIRFADLRAESLFQGLFTAIPPAADPAMADRELFSDPEQASAGAPDRARAFLHVQNGCDAGCTFCVIPALRGASRSAAPDQVVAWARHFLAQGFRELVLTGINLGAYGRDLVDPTTLSHLVEHLLELPNLGRLRLSSMAPQDLDLSFMTLLQEQPRLAPHLHLSLQSGDNLILKRMRRPYTREELLVTIETLRERRPEIVLGADIIVGFPTETEAAFARTLDLLQEGKIALPHVFRYSDRPGTPAARIPSHLRVSPEQLRERAECLRQAARAILHTTLMEQVGSEGEVLVETVADGLAQGKTGGFLPLAFPAADPDLVGQLVRVTVTGVDASGAGLVGKTR
ncbi:MAG: tRNA (N(6)-L-threonylcarbamoyladenosine(37)-C(2))-methylthiotransferase MtaB [Magnetococcales bacterium]|nr:tRNA (N(6)-L-threonylcarbamoyladenosine(37)-C(2))-methylthiotransferase MtaB [Magnetococcales bacterium]